MTLTLDLTPAEEARLTTAARHAGVAPDALLKKFVDSLPPADVPTVARAAAIQAVRGSLADVGATADDLHRQRQADKAAEERQTSGPLP